MLEDPFLFFIAIGFIAQLIDGALGMAYGIASTSALMALGMPPAIASANVHAAEVFTTAASGAFHAIARNIDWRLFRRLAIAGAIGGSLGAILVSRVDVDAARPLICAYLFVMGLIVVRRALQRERTAKTIERVSLLGFFGGFCDATGGGGWGPVVASNLLARGAAPAKVVGTVNLAEFFVTVAISVAFITSLGPSFGRAALGLVIGGVAAAPIAAFAAKRLPRRTLTALVGAAICIVSAYNIWSSIN